jgi:hypothetical protein
VKLWLAGLPEHPRASLSPADADRLTGAASVGRPRDSQLDANGQASR